VLAVASGVRVGAGKGTGGTIGMVTVETADTRGETNSEAVTFDLVTVARVEATRGGVTVATVLGEMTAEACAGSGVTSRTDTVVATVESVFGGWVTNGAAETSDAMGEAVTRTGAIREVSVRISFSPGAGLED